MTADEARAALVTVLAEIAPEADLDTVEPDAGLREELDLDSLDFLNLVEGLADRTGVVIPERDYGLLVTLTDWIGYLTSHAGAAAR